MSWQRPALFEPAVKEAIWRFTGLVSVEMKFLALFGVVRGKWLGDHKIVAGWQSSTVDDAPTNRELFCPGWLACQDTWRLNLRPLASFFTFTEYEQYWYVP